MTYVKVYNSKVGRIVNEFTCDDDEARAIARSIVHGSGSRNVKEYFESIVGYDNNGRDSISVSFRKV